MNIEISLKSDRTMGARIRTQGKALAQLILAYSICRKFSFGNQFHRAAAIEAAKILGPIVNWLSWDEEEQEAQIGLRLPDPDEPGGIWEPSIYLSVDGEVSSTTNLPLEEIQEKLNQPC